MKDINLLPSFIERKEDSAKAIKIVVLILCILTIAGTGAGALLIEYTIDELEIKKTEIQSEIDKLIVVEEIEREVENKRSELNATIDLINVFEDKSIINYKLLQVIAKSLPEGVFLEKYRVDSTETLELNGVCKDEKNAILLVCKLKELDEVKKVNFRNISKSGEESDNYNFSISIDIK